MADVTSAFEAKSLSVYDLFSKPGQFFISLHINVNTHGEGSVLQVCELC